jgi:hypothetical protein
VRGVFALIQTQKIRFLVPWHPAVAATNNLTTDLLPTREVPCAWPAPALAGWYCYLGILPLRGGHDIVLFHISHIAHTSLHFTFHLQAAARPPGAASCELREIGLLLLCVE